MLDLDRTDQDADWIRWVRDNRPADKYATLRKLQKLERVTKGFEDHEGRPGEVGGSLPKGQTHGEEVKAPTGPAKAKGSKAKQPSVHEPRDLGGGMVSNEFYDKAVAKVEKAQMKKIHTEVIGYGVGQRLFNVAGRTEPLTEEQYKAIMLTNLRSLVHDKPVSIRSDEVAVDGILEAGRFKTQFETGTTHGRLQPEIRKEVEEENGVAWDTPDIDRPIYGFVETGTDCDKCTRQYGSVEWVLKKSVRARTSFTLGDSLDEQGKVVASPLEDPQAHSIALRHTKRMFNDDIKGISMGYVEAQVHGGVKLDDIDYVVYRMKEHKGLAPGDMKYGIDLLRKKLDKYGIRMEVT